MSAVVTRLSGAIVLTPSHALALHRSDLHVLACLSYLSFTLSLFPGVTRSQRSDQGKRSFAVWERATDNALTRENTRRTTVGV